jgi:hypothetical protein
VISAQAGTSVEIRYEHSGIGLGETRLRPLGDGASCGVVAGGSVVAGCGGGYCESPA